MVICVTGTPGTGKTTYSKKLAKKLKYKYVDVSKIIKEEKLYEEYDRKNKEYVVDEKKLSKFLLELTKVDKELVIDSHLSHYLKAKNVEKVIVMKCELKELKKRLDKRKYNKQKIQDNMDSEIFDICKNEAEELGHKVEVLWSTKN